MTNGIALILVDDPDPALADADQLDGDAVVMDPVGDRPASAILMCEAM
jgi:hypothetical protein